MKKPASFLCLAIFLFMGIPVCQGETIYTPPEHSREELYQAMFISLLMPHIQRSINNYYSRYLTESPVVYPYFVYVLDAKRLQAYRSFDFLVKVKVDSVVGPHISVGTDNITFRISGGGKVEMQKLEHIKIEQLPEHWRHIIRQGASGY